MKTIKIYPSPIQLARVFDLRKGKLYWRSTTGNRLAGSKAGTITKRGYVVISYNSQSYYAHRLIWIIHNNKSLKASDIIDHRDQDPTNNNPSNLRRTTVRGNGCNRKDQACYHNLQLLPSGRYRILIQHNGCNRSYGTYPLAQALVKRDQLLKSPRLR